MEYNEKTGELEVPSWDDQEHLHDIYHKSDFEAVTSINKNTVGLLGEEWKNNVRENSKLWKKHIPLASPGVIGLGKNKCVIGIGSGRSFNKNKDVLKHYVNADGLQHWEERDFITISANHQFKPLLEMGIIPDFVMLVDGSDVVYDQLCKDVPEEAQNVQLIAGLHSSPKVIKEWDKQGRGILFFLNPAPECQKMFKDYVHEDPEPHKIDLGGNVINGAFMVGITRFHSNVYTCVGNDLSYELKDTIDEQRKAYYADGDYSTNAEKTGTGRDEAKSKRGWGGFTLTKKKIILPDEPMGRYDIELDTVGTNATLWVYKCWLEITMLGQARRVKDDWSLNYYNCTEGGIAGVMCKVKDREKMIDEKNWFMLDEVALRKKKGIDGNMKDIPIYHTAMLEDFLPFFIKQRRQFLCQAMPQHSHQKVLRPLGSLNAPCATKSGLLL